jgi:hypothetical protein
VTPIRLDQPITKVGNGWRVRRDDGTERMVLPRHDTGYAVFDGTSTADLRNPPLGYADSWRQDPDKAIEWARTTDV